MSCQSTDAADDLKKKTVQYETDFEMPPGKYHIKVVVRENQGGTLGPYETDVIVPDLKKDSLKLSASVDPGFAALTKGIVIMGSSLNPQSDDPEFVLNPRFEFNFWFDPEAAHRAASPLAAH